MSFAISDKSFSCTDKHLNEGRYVSTILTSGENSFDISK